MNALATIRHIVSHYIGKRPQQAKQLRYAEYIVQMMQARMRQAAAGQAAGSSLDSAGNTGPTPQTDHGSTNILERIAVARSNSGNRAAHDKWWIKP